MRQIFDEKPDSILDLGTGSYNIHLDVKKIKIEEPDENGEQSILKNKYSAKVIRVNNPSYSGIVNSLIREKYTIDKELALHRQRDVKKEEFAAYNDYCEQCKEMVKEVLS